MTSEAHLPANNINLLKLHFTPDKRLSTIEENEPWQSPLEKCRLLISESLNQQRALEQQNRSNVKQKLENSFFKQSPSQSPLRCNKKIEVKYSDGDNNHCPSDTDQSVIHRKKKHAKIRKAWHRAKEVIVDAFTSGHSYTIR